MEVVKPMNVRIRSAEVADAEALAALGAATFIESFGSLYSRSDLDAFLEDGHSADAYRTLLADPAYALWIAEGEGGDAIGYAVAGPCGLPVADLPPRSGELKRIYLRASAQGGGVGGRLLAAALDDLRARFDHVYIGVFSENFGAHRLYRRFGFEKVGEYQFMVGEQADREWIMKLMA